MRKNINIIVILAVVAVLIFLALGFMGLKGAGPEQSPEGSLASAQIIMEELQNTGSVSALRVADVVVGEGDAVASGDLITVHYTGILPDGTVFDSSAKQGRPFPFVVGTGYVIQGWDQGLIGMKQGGRRLLVIPPHLGYGANEHGPIPANSTLVFEVELVSRIPAGAVQASAE